MFLGFDLWPLKVIWGWKKVIPFKSSYMNSYLTSMDTISLSCTIFELFDTKLLGLTLTFHVWTSFGVEKNYTIRKSIYDFLFDFYGQHLSISYCFRDIWLQSFQGLTLTFDPWRSAGVKNSYNIQKPIYDFLFEFYGQYFSISYRFRDIRLQSFKVRHWPLNPEGHLGSNFF